jgi:hypothetical protein
MVVYHRCRGVCRVEDCVILHRSWWSSGVGWSAVRIRVAAVYALFPDICITEIFRPVLDLYTVQSTKFSAVHTVSNLPILPEARLKHTPAFEPTSDLESHTLM